MGRLLALIGGIFIAVGGILLVVFGLVVSAIINFFLRLFGVKRPNPFQAKGATYTFGRGFDSFNRQRQEQQSQQKPKEGGVTISKDGDKDRDIDKSIGEYVDFQEIKE